MGFLKFEPVLLTHTVVFTPGCSVAPEKRERERENVTSKAYFIPPNFNYDLTVGLSGLRISA